MATEARAEPIRPRRDVLQLLVPSLGLVLVGVVLAWLLVNLAKSPDAFFRVLFIGITVGALYALVALGYSLVYGILELINFAHGDVFMLGGMMTTAVLLDAFGLGESPSIGSLAPAIVAALAVAMVGCGLLNATIERVAYKPLRHAPRLAALITAIGMSFIVQDIALVWKGSQSIAVPNVLPKGHIFQIGEVEYRWNQLIVLIITVPVLLGLVYLVQFTRQGKAMRATAQDRDAAAMMGIDVDRTISFTFLVAGCLAGAAGVVFVTYTESVRFDTGFQLGLIAFTSAVLGGIGNLPGAVLGGLLIGLIQAFNEGLSWYAPGPNWTQSIVFTILILILVFRPQGLLGERTPEGG
ncbi:MAG: branched-chain amino acid ABC transporter permease [Thermoleophilia bacterium]